MERGKARELILLFPTKTSRFPWVLQRVGGRGRNHNAPEGLQDQERRRFVEPSSMPHSDRLEPSFLPLQPFSIPHRLRS